MNEPDHIIASRHWERAWACDCGPCTRHRLVQAEERREALASLQRVTSPILRALRAESEERSPLAVIARERARVACVPTLECSRPDIQPNGPWSLHPSRWPDWED